MRNWRWRRPSLVENARGRSGITLTATRKRRYDYQMMREPRMGAMCRFRGLGCASLATCMCKHTLPCAPHHLPLQAQSHRRSPLDHSRKASAYGSLPNGTSKEQQPARRVNMSFHDALWGMTSEIALAKTTPGCSDQCPSPSAPRGHSQPRRPPRRPPWKPTRQGVLAPFAPQPTHKSTWRTGRCWRRPRCPR